MQTLANPFTRFTVVLLSLTLALGVRADEADDQYVKLNALIQQADDLAKGQQADAAKSKYEQIKTALLKFKKQNPDWKPKVVEFRLKYLDEKIATFSAPPSDADSGSSSAPATATVSKPVAKGAALPAGVQLKLVSAGAEPREALRQHCEVGDTQTITIRAQSTMAFEAAGMPPQDMKLPAMIMVLSAKPTRAAESGEMEFELKLEETRIESEAGGDAATEAAAAAMKDSIAKMKGVVITGTFTDRGFTRKVQAKSAAGADKETREGIEELKENFAKNDFVLPEEPVGVGARWEIRQKAKVQNMTVDEIVKHELVARDGSVLTIKTTTQQMAANQKIPNPMMPGTTADLVKLEGTETSTTTYDLTKMLPIKVTSDERSVSALKANILGQAINATIKSGTTSTLESK